jgi:hypothetical protein
MDTAATAWLFMQNDHSEPGEPRQGDEPYPIPVVASFFGAVWFRGTIGAAVKARMGSSDEPS